jgi:DNA-binding response OmpR family regulator
MSLMHKHLLLIEDDQTLRQFLIKFLQKNGFIVTSYEQGAKAIHYVTDKKPDLVILDLQLPDISGESVLKSLRETHPTLPVIILTAKSTVTDITQGLNLGADDYLGKPFDAQELLARIHARLRNPANEDQVLHLHDLTLDLNARELTKNDKVIPLTKTEFDLLHTLMIHIGTVLTREMLLNHVWGYNHEIETRVVDVYIGYLRKKIDTPPNPTLIKSKRGYGYYIKKPQKAI